jgi:hypothetical protein
LIKHYEAGKEMPLLQPSQLQCSDENKMKLFT